MRTVRAGICMISGYMWWIALWHIFIRILPQFYNDVCLMRFFDAICRVGSFRLGSWHSGPLHLYINWLLVNLWGRGQQSPANICLFPIREVRIWKFGGSTQADSYHSRGDFPSDEGTSPKFLTRDSWLCSFSPCDLAVSSCCIPRKAADFEPRGSTSPCAVRKRRPGVLKSYIIC